MHKESEGEYQNESDIEYKQSIANIAGHISCKLPKGAKALPGASYGPGRFHPSKQEEMMAHLRDMTGEWVITQAHPHR
jgi:hypothetical protein